MKSEEYVLPDHVIRKMMEELWPRLRLIPDDEIARIERFSPVREGEFVAGFVPLELRQLATFAQQAGRQDDLHPFFWIQFHEALPELYDKPYICIRSGWRAVWRPGPVADPGQGFFKPLLGGGVLRDLILRTPPPQTPHAVPLAA